MRFPILFLLAGCALAQTVEFFQPPEALASCAVGINARGDIAGWYTKDVDPGVLVVPRRLGYLSTRGEFLDIEPPAANVAHTTAADVNERGEVVGYWAETGTGLFHGFLYRDGEYIAIDFPGEKNTYAIGINAIGEIVGSYRGADGWVIGFLRTAGGEYRTIRLRLGEYWVRLWAINARGDMAGQFGYSSSSATWHGFYLSKHGEVTILDPPDKNPGGPSWAIGINEQGDVTGDYQGLLPDGTTATRSFIWRNGVYTTFGPDLFARGINPRGSVVGCGVYGPTWASFVRSPR